jgi:hypothetical protein
VNDYFRHLAADPAMISWRDYEFSRDLTLAICWTIYSQALVWVGVRRRLIPFLYCGAVAAAFAIVWVVSRGPTFKPLERFDIFLNSRSFAMLVVIGGAAGLVVALKKLTEGQAGAAKARAVLRIVIAMMFLTLITVEIKDHFEKAILLASSTFSGEPGLLMDEIHRLRNLQQMWLSVGGLLHSILLMGYGIWKRIPSLRILAIVLFGVAILKIFIYDLSFLETLYRIFSFIGLGLILLAVSYLYQRYKSVIFDAQPRSNL